MAQRGRKMAKGHRLTLDWIACGISVSMTGEITLRGVCCLSAESRKRSWPFTGPVCEMSSADGNGKGLDDLRMRCETKCTLVLADTVMDVFNAALETCGRQSGRKRRPSYNP